MNLIPKPRRVVIESPFQRSQAYTVEQHITYLDFCILDCVKRGESPYASHDKLAKILDDNAPSERAFGIEAGWVWGELADAIVVYIDFGISAGMSQSIDHYQKMGKTIEHRRLSTLIVDDIIKSGQN